MNQKDICSYIVSSKCLAPTVDFSLKAISNTDIFLEKLFKVSYFEYNEKFIDQVTSKVENTIVSSADSLVLEFDQTKLLGGTMFDVSYLKAAGDISRVPGQFFADWITGENAKVIKYIDVTSSAAWKQQVDAWNYFAANIKWAKNYPTLPLPTSIDYKDSMVNKKDRYGNIIIGPGNTVIKMAPERPIVPPRPAGYGGPKWNSDAIQPEGTFQITDGFGRPAAGRLAVQGPTQGLGKSFGVKGQGNEASALPISAASDLIFSQLIPANPLVETDSLKCKKSYLIVNVHGTEI